MTTTIDNNQKLEILIDLGADVHTLTNIAIVMKHDDFSALCDDLVGEYTGEGVRYDLFRWAQLKRDLAGIFE